MKRSDLSYFRKLPTLETERLILRKMLPSDLQDVYAYASNPETSRYLLWHPHESLSYTKGYLARVERFYRLGKFYDFAVVEKSSGRMIGTCGFTSFDLDNNSAEIGYVLNPSSHRRGYATEAVKKILEIAFTVLDLERVEARCFAENYASLRVAEKAGMTYEGIARSKIHNCSRYINVATSAIVSEDYRKVLS